MIHINFEKQERGGKLRKLATLEIENFDKDLLDYMTKWFEVKYGEIKICIIG